MEGKIHYFQEDVDFKIPEPLKTRKWIKKVVELEKKEIIEINYIFCSDTYLHQINVDYLNHDTYTDIITFDNSETEGKIESDIFISIERVAENAKDLGTPFKDELQRVMIHGVLHLCGNDDLGVEAKKQMRLKEDTYLSLR